MQLIENTTMLMNVEIRVQITLTQSPPIAQQSRCQIHTLCLLRVNPHIIITVVGSRKVITESSKRETQLKMCLAALPLDADWTMTGTANTPTRFSNLHLIFTTTTTW